MIVRVLGSAAGGGVPQWNCRCANCQSARAGTAPARMQASIAVSADGSAWVLVNATTDIRRQLEQLPQVPGNRLRSSPVSGVLLTDANVDHAAGLLELRQAQSMRIVSSALVRDTLVGGNAMFGLLAQGDRMWSVFDAGVAPVALPGLTQDLRVTAIDVPGLQPQYAGAAELPGSATAYCFESRRGERTVRMLYAPIFLQLTTALLAAADASDALFFDGSFWSDGELASLGLGTRCAREMGHAPMDGSDGWLSAMAEHAAAAGSHRYCTHVNNSNPVLDPRSPAARALRDASFSVAADGMEIVLDGRG